MSGGHEIAFNGLAPNGLPEATFWKQFVTEFWEQKPIVLKSAFDPGFVSAEELWNSFRSVCIGYRTRTNVPDAFIRAWLHNTAIRTDLEDWLPKLEDQTVVDYLRRIETASSDHGFSVMLNFLHLHSRTLWKRFRPFFENIYSYVGLPPGGADSDVLVGKYRKTGFGVHKDSASNFTFVVEGTKTIIAWPGEFAGFPKGNTIHYEQHLPHAIVLRGEPGDIIYWPSSYWHVGESPSGSMTLQLAYYFSPLLFERVGRDLTLEMMQTCVKWAGENRRSPRPILDGDRTDLPMLLRGPEEVLKRLCRPVTSQRLLIERMTDVWLRQLSGSGFLAVPPAVQAPEISDDCILLRADDCRIFSKPLKGDRLIVASNGLSLVVENAQLHTQALRIISAGRAFRMGQLTDDLARGRTFADSQTIRSLMREFVHSLVSFETLHLVDS